MKRSRFLSMALSILVLISLVPVSTTCASAAWVAYPPDGDYIIVPEASNGYALDVTGGGNAQPGTFIQLYERNSTDAQIFRLRRVNGDWYTITHIRTGYVINLKDGNSFNDARFWLWPFDGTDACYFRFKTVGSSYLIQSKVGEQRVVDLHEARPYNSAVVHQWAYHENLSARWKLIPASSGSSSASNNYFPRYTGNSGSITFALSSLGISSSYSYRSQIAAANGIGGYGGTVSQNTKMLNLLKAGQLKRPGISTGAPAQPTTSSPSPASSSYFPRYTGRSGSITSALSSLGINSSFSNRSQIAAANGISGYSGTASQNTNMLNLLKAGQLKRPGASTSSSEQPAASGSLVSSNLSRVSFLRQQGDSCKATAAAMAANLITGRNQYSTSSMIYSGVMCKDLNGNTYTGSDGNRYRTTYQTDSYRGSYSDLKNRIDTAISNGLPIVVPVHSTTGGIRHHWVVLVGQDSRGNYLIVDPGKSGSGSMANNSRTMSSLGYDFGLTDYSTPHYGYISFAR